MIISHKHKYCFLQVPHTGCTAVARELLDRYDGDSLLGKHSTYGEFASAVQNHASYYTFLSVRHPLDDIVSDFEKLRSNHERYEDPARWVENGGFVTSSALERFRFVNDGASFAEYVKAYHNRPFDSWASMDRPRANRVLRFETLADDFETALVEIGFDPVRRLGQANPTRRENGNWESYYEDPSLQRFVGPVVWPFMRRWDYQFPSDWQHPPLIRRSIAELAYRVLRPRREGIWSHPASLFDDGKQGSPEPEQA